MTEKWTREAWNAASKIYDAIVAHPFITGLSDGSLPVEMFDRYLCQDELYIANYGRQMFEFAQMIEDPQQHEMFVTFAREGMEGEKAMHDLQIGRAHV